MAAAGDSLAALCHLMKKIAFELHRWEMASDRFNLPGMTLQQRSPFLRNDEGVSVHVSYFYF